MKKILVPINFCESSENAYRYAAAMAEKLKAELEVLHVFHPTSESASFAMNYDFDELKEKKAKALDDFVNQMTDGNDEMDTVLKATMVKQSIEVGFAAETIVKISKRPDINWIIMGTKGQERFVDRLLGTVTSFVAQHAHCPVIIVPQGVPFLNFQKIMYASNYESADDNLLKNTIDFAGHFDAKVHLVHVHDQKEQGSHEMQDLLMEQLFRKKARHLDFEVSLSSVNSKTVWDGLFQYAEKEGIDLIVLATHQRKFWDQLFHKSMTKELALQARFPFMVLHEEA